MLEKAILTFVFTLVFALGFLSHQSHAEDSAETKEDDLQWTACQAQTDCVKIKGFCRLPAAVHKDDKKKFQAYVRENKGSVNCFRYRNMKYDRVTEVSCENNKCTLIIP